MATMKCNVRTGLLGLVVATAALSSLHRDAPDVHVGDALSLRSLMFRQHLLNSSPGESHSLLEQESRAKRFDEQWMDILPIDIADPIGNAFLENARNSYVEGNMLSYELFIDHLLEHVHEMQSIRWALSPEEHDDLDYRIQGLIWGQIDEEHLAKYKAEDESEWYDPKLPDDDEVEVIAEKIGGLQEGDDKKIWRLEEEFVGIWNGVIVSDWQVRQYLERSPEEYEAAYFQARNAYVAGNGVYAKVLIESLWAKIKNIMKVEQSHQWMNGSTVEFHNNNISTLQRGESEEQSQSSSELWKRSSPVATLLPRAHNYSSLFTRSMGAQQEIDGAAKGSDEEALRERSMQRALDSRYQYERQQRRSKY